MPTFKKKKNIKGSWSVRDIKKAMESVLAAKISVRKGTAVVGFNLPKSSLQDRISKIRKDSEVQVAPVLLHWHLPNKPRCFF
jgi:hypothetical protein